MALLDLSFNQAEIQEAQKGGQFELIPPGNYVAEINRSEVKQTKDGRGSYLSLGFKILDGEFSGRLVFQNITLQNANPQASQIGRHQLAQLAGACNMQQIHDTEQLHGIPMQIRVAIRKDKSGQYDDQNEIKKFAALSNAGYQQPTFSAPMQPQTPQPQAPQQRANPWERGVGA